MKAVLKVDNITKIYKSYTNSSDRLKEIFFNTKAHQEFIANDSLSFELFEGETLGIIGANGAGKSTILKIIAGVIAPTSGTIHKSGRVTALLELGTGFNQEMSGYDNIFLNGTLIGMTHKEIEQKLDQIINFSELGHYINQPIKTYSSGMSMRLAFSIAIFSHPAILIVDEALSVGDAHFSAKCINALKKRKEQKMSIIYVSHDLNSLKVLCDRILLLDRGKLIFQGEPEEVINHYNFLIAKLNDANESLNYQSDSQNVFGTFEAKIQKVLLKKQNQIAQVFDTGDKVSLEVEIHSKIDIESATLGFHIKDKYSQDIYGTNTHLQKISLHLQKNRTYLCKFEFELNIGVGNYSLGVALHQGLWHTDRCFHWYENALSFDVVSNKDNSFIGLCRLTPTIKIQPLPKERTDAIS